MKKIKEEVILIGGTPGNVSGILRNLGFETLFLPCYAFEGIENGRPE
jgi:hypothetical protein